MTTIRDIDRVKGTVFDLPHAMSLSPSDCNVLVVSSRTLFFVQLFGTGEMDFVSRYASSLLDGNKYVLAEDSADLDDINDLVNNYELEVQPVTCDLVAAIEALTEATVQAGSGCCTPYGPDYPPPAPDLGDPDIAPPPDDWSTWESYYTYKCKAANMIVDNWIDTLTGLATLSGILSAIGALALAAFVNTSLLSGLLVGLMMLGFSAGAAAAIIIGALIYIIAGGIQLLVYFLEVGNVMENTKSDLICLLYEAQSPADAKDAVVLFTSDIAENIAYDPADDSTLFQIQLDAIVDALFNDAIVNVLFEENPDANVYVGDVDCDDCQEFSPDCYYWTATTSPFNIIVYGQRDDPPYWSAGADIFDDVDGWCTTTPRTAGTYQEITFYIKNPVYGHPEWGTGANDVYWSTSKIWFTCQNFAIGNPLFSNMGFGGVSDKVRGPGYDNATYRADYSGSPPLDTWEQMNLGLDPLQEWISVSFAVKYDTNYNQAQKASMRKFLLCTLDDPPPWE